MSRRQQRGGVLCLPSRMKFGKRAKQAFASLEAGLPAFPYCKMKKVLKASLNCKCRADIPAKFFGALHVEVRRCDRRWMTATAAVLLAVRLPLSTKLLMQAMHRPSSIIQAQRLVAWAELAREAIRKLVSSDVCQDPCRCAVGVHALTLH